MGFDQISTSVSIISSGLKGYQAISLTNFTTSAESIIASGSAIEISNAFFLADSDITPNASSWTAVTTANTAYITLTPSGSAGSQVLAAAYSDTAPVWSTSKQGWYQSAGSLMRYVGRVYKSGTASYENASVLIERQGEMSQLTYEIGEWNMDASHSVTGKHGLQIDQIRRATAYVRNDDGTVYYELAGASQNGDQGGRVLIGPTTWQAERAGGGLFDSATFDATAGTVANRGWVTLDFEA